jgi:hypothetical protein
MPREAFIQSEQPNETARLAHLFRELGDLKEGADTVFEDLEDDLVAAGFELGDAYSVVNVLHDPMLYCRSESFTRVMELLLDKKDIDIKNSRDDANMCRVEGGAGFRVAMLEGFSGKDVDAATKVVMTFSGEHLTSHDSITRDSSLWQTKPETARVSLRGQGSVSFNDVQMVSFRFPAKFFPKDLLTEEERDRFEDGQSAFVVRHFVTGKKKKDQSLQ